MAQRKKPVVNKGIFAIEPRKDLGIGGTAYFWKQGWGAGLKTGELIGSYTRIKWTHRYPLHCGKEIHTLRSALDLGPRLRPCQVCKVIMKIGGLHVNLHIDPWDQSTYPKPSLLSSLDTAHPPTYTKHSHTEKLTWTQETELLEKLNDLRGKI